MSFKHEDVSEIVRSNKDMMELYLIDNNFRTSIDCIRQNEISMEQILGIIFMLCDGHKNTTDQLIKYINKYGIINE